MGILNKLKYMFNSGELAPADHIGQIELVKNEANKISELTWGYNEAYFDHMREQNTQNTKTPGQVNMETLKKEVEGMTRPQLGNYQEVSPEYQLESGNEKREDEEEHSIDI